MVCIIFFIFQNQKYALVSKKAQKHLLQDSSADFDFGHFYFSKNVQNDKTPLKKGQKTCFRPCRCISQKKSLIFWLHIFFIFLKNHLGIFYDSILYEEKNAEKCRKCRKIYL